MYRITTLTLIILIVLVLSLSISVRASIIVNHVVFELDFSNSVEALRYLDITTENYDSGGDGSSRLYIDESLQVLVFEGNNSDTSQGYDEPIAVVKGYNEPDGFSSYAVLPYNYTVSVLFMIPAEPGKGNFYIFPRYDTVADKYEVVVDTQYNNIVVNYVKSNNWVNIATFHFGDVFTIAPGVWYNLTAKVEWRYNHDEGKYMNHFTIILLDTQNVGSSYTAEVWDDNLSPNTYKGLAFLGFHASDEFKVYMDDVRVVATFEKTGEEPAESITPSDLDIVASYLLGDSTMICILLDLAGNIQVDSGVTKYWVVQLDVDKDSRSTPTGWDYDYSVVVQADPSGGFRGDLYDSGGNWLTRLHILGGGLSHDYIIVEVDRSALAGLGDSLYLYAYTQLGSNPVDGYPANDNQDTGDYIIHYLLSPRPTSGWTGLSDVEGDTGNPDLDIKMLTAANSPSLIFLNLTVSGSYPWYGGSDTGIYRIYIDADNDVTTGYPVGGIGADYMIEHVAGYAPKLWSYTGTGSDWSWSFISRIDYLENPGSERSAVYLAPKSDFTGVPLGGEATITAQTGTGTSIADETSSSPVPIPESTLVGLAAGLATIATIIAINRRHWQTHRL